MMESRNNAHEGKKETQRFSSVDYPSSAGSLLPADG
jgi:hypothetical protein